MATATKKNSWVKRAVSKAVDVASDVMSAPSRAKSAIKATKGQWGLTSKMMGKAGMAEGIMGAKNFDKAFNTIKGSVKSGNMVKAREYVQDQTRKIAEQKKTSAEMQKFIKGAKKAGHAINKATGEVVNPTPGLVKDFNKKFTTYK
jgi:hypothetical protein